MNIDPRTPPVADSIMHDQRGNSSGQEAAAELAAIEDRVAMLFRLSTRRGLIHPLQHVLLRYRRGERA